MALWTLQQWRALSFLLLLLLFFMGWRLISGGPLPAFGAGARVSPAVAAAADHEEGVSPAEAESCRLSEAASDRGENPPPGAFSAVADGRIDINTADVAALQQLPGIGPVLARRIVDYRERWGPFHDPADLLEVRGIGEATLRRLLPYVRVSPP